MKKIRCEWYLFSCKNPKEAIRYMERINRLLSCSGFADIQLEMAEKRQTVDISFVVDNVLSIPKARGHVIFQSSECTVHNPLLMDYSIT